MKPILSGCLVAAFLLNSFFAGAQTKGHDFTAIDQHVQSLGTLDSMTMGSISKALTEKFTDKMEKAHAIYYWITHNINFDVKAARISSDEKYYAAKVLATRKATSAGMALLFQDMCSSADIRCLTVDGYLRNSTEQIGEKSPEKNHTWAVVQLGLSPETWFYVDPCLGSGYPDAEMKNFTKYYNPGYFFTDKELFNVTHFPDNLAWKLGPGSKNRNDFFELPLIKGFAAEAGMKSFAPRNGLIKTALDKSIHFSYTFPPDASVSKVTVITGEKKRQKTKDINFSFSGGSLGFDLKIDQDGSYPLSILLDGKEFMTYMVDVE